ncbi:MAG: VWA domain-containing protein, partial [Andreesenia angusta]|nr:VWA domain-containing protein [Andreesenia angusta]
MGKRYISFLLALLLSLSLIMELTHLEAFAITDMKTEEENTLMEEASDINDEILIEFETLGGEEISAKVLKRGEKIKELPKPEKNGDEFLYWEFEDYTEVKTPLIIEEDIVLYARWKSDLGEDSNYGEENINDFNEDETYEEENIKDFNNDRIYNSNINNKSRISEIDLTRGKNEDLPVEPGEVKLSKTATPVEDKVNTWDIKLRILAKDDPKTSDIILVMDTSGSMGRKNRIESAKKAANNFIDKLLPSNTTRIGIVKFSRDASIASNLTNNKDILKEAINDLSTGGGTFTQAGVKKAEEVLAASTADNKHIVLLSDGVPTYSYKHDTKNDNFGDKMKVIDVVNGNNEYNGYFTKIPLPSSKYDYSKRVGIGRSLVKEAKKTGFWWNTKYYYYHHGNSAINEAQYAKDAGYNIWPIGLSVNDTGKNILKQMGSDNNYYDASPATLESIFEEIAGEIGAAVQDATVSDPMGQGFEIKGDNITNISATQGSPNYDEIEKRLTWDPGTLTTLLPGQEDIRYAELTYRVEINDEILNASSEDGLYPTNGTTTIHYKNASGEDVTTEFEVPKVKPILYKVEKELQDKDGNIITKDEDFKIEINGPSSFNHKVILNTKESGNISTDWLTNLREIGEHNFIESDNDDYETIYYIKNTEGEWVEGDTFNIAQNDDNHEIKVVNKEISGKLTITKILNGEDLSGSTPKTFEFKVTGPDNFEEVFSLPDGNDLWTKTFENLKFGSYRVEELTTGYITSAIVDGQTVEPGNINLSFDKENREHTVEVTNEYHTVDLKFDKRIKETIEKIAGAEFTLYQTNDEWNIGAQIGEPKLSDGENNIIF